MLHESDMSDERRHKRRQQVVGVRMQSPTLNGRIVDVSGTGIGIETPQCVSAGERHHIRISFGGRTVEGEGFVRWTRRAAQLLVGLAEVPVFRAGIELDLSPRPASR